MPKRKPAPASTPAPSPVGVKLQWAPPTLVDPVMVDVSGGTGTSRIYDAGGRDALVRFTGEATSRLIIRNARNVVLIGGEIDVDMAWSNPSERWGLYFQDCFGVLHVEGLHVHGDALTEGIDLGQVVYGATSPHPERLVLQNCRIVDLRDPTGSFHADAVQCWGGTRGLWIDKCTFRSQFQNLMLKAEANEFLDVRVQRLDMGGIDVQQAYMLNTRIPGTRVDGRPWCRGPVAFGGDGSYGMRVYATRPAASKAGADFGHADFGKITTPNYQSSLVTDRPLLGTQDGRKFLAWPTASTPTISGQVWEGPRPEGDYCTTADCGLGYVSPGYLEAA